MMTFRQPFRGDFQITQRFGEKITSKAGHSGIDYDCPYGTEILASADGIVRFAGWDSTGYGYCVIIQHSVDRATLYAHLSAIKVKTLQPVEQSDLIGLSGFSGNVVPASEQGRHLHFEARTQWNKFSTAFDPMLLPLQTVDDTITVPDQPDPQQPAALKDADAFQPGDRLRIVCPDGAKAFFDAGFSYSRLTSYPQGTIFYYSGETVKNPANGYTYLRCVPADFSVWIAVHNDDTQILDVVAKNQKK